MTEFTIFWMIGSGVLVGLAVGLIGGAVLFYYIDFKPLRDNYNELVHTLTHMKKQGFVPQYNLTQEVPLDLTTGVDES